MSDDLRFRTRSIDLELRQHVFMLPREYEPFTSSNSSMDLDMNKPSQGSVPGQWQSSNSRPALDERTSSGESAVLGAAEYNPSQALAAGELNSWSGEDPTVGCAGEEEGDQISVEEEQEVSVDLTSVRQSSRSPLTSALPSAGISWSGL